MKNIPSDFKLMSEIYRRHYEQFKNFNRKTPDREVKTYVPVDIEAIAQHFKTDEEIIFGRLYLHLEKKYGYKNDDGSISPFFTKKIGKDMHAINFPLLASVIAGLQEERSRQNLTLKISAFAVVVSLFALFVNGFNVWHNISSESDVQTHLETQNTRGQPKK
ncbi:MAG: hypothetical protein Q7W05_14305 [Deltaproteobacteria bacterium]|nr:hypothetical protein [Deltaproteobacteria bacterium]